VVFARGLFRFGREALERRGEVFNGLLLFSLSLGRLGVSGGCGLLGWRFGCGLLFG